MKNGLLLVRSQLLFWSLHVLFYGLYTWFIELSAALFPGKEKIL